MMDASKNGYLTRIHHANLSVPLLSNEKIKYRIVRLGKEEDNIRLIKCPSQYVSRIHCEIHWADNAFWITDLKSSNGTFLNGDSLTPHKARELRFGDIIGMGISHLQPNQLDSDATAIDVKDPKCYIFKFDKKSQVIDLDDEDESNNNEGKGKENISGKNKSEDSDDDIQIIDEISHKSSPSASTASDTSPRKAMPPPPPPPIISKSFKEQMSKNSPCTSPVVAAASTSSASIKDKVTPSSVKQSSSSTCNSAPDKPFLTSLPLTSASSSSRTNSNETKNKRISSTDDPCQPPVKRTKQDDGSPSSSDDSSDGLGDVVNVHEDDIRNPRQRNMQNVYLESGSSSGNSSSDDEMNDDGRAQATWMNIPTDKLDKVKRKTKPLTPPPQERHASHSHHAPSNHEVSFQSSDEEETEGHNADRRWSNEKDLSRDKSPPTYSSDSEDERTSESMFIKRACNRDTVSNDVHKSNKNLVTGYAEENVEDTFRGGDEWTRSPSPKSPEDKSSEDPVTPTTKVPPRGIQLLSDAPLPRFAARAQLKNAPFKPPMPPSASKVSKSPYFTKNSPISSLREGALQFRSKEEQNEVRKQKLKELERKNQLEREENSYNTPRKAPQPAKIKMTSRNRNQGLMDSIINSSSKTNDDVEQDEETDKLVQNIDKPRDKPETIPVPDINPNDPRLNRGISRVIPHDPRIKKGPVQVNGFGLPTMPPKNPVPSTSKTTYIRDQSSCKTPKVNQPNILKPGAEVILSPPSGIGNIVAYKEKAPGQSDKVKPVEYPSLVSEDDIYKRILSWNASWLQEQKDSTLCNVDPPLLDKNETLTNTLSFYDTFDAYFQIYYYLLLFEMWAYISNDVTNKQPSNEVNTHIHGSKRTKYEVKIDEIKRQSICVVVPKPRNSKKNENQNDPMWLNIRYHTVVRTKGEIDYKKDLIILHLEGIDTKTNQKISKKQFAYPCINSERYEPMNRDNSSCDKRLLKHGGHGGGYKYSEVLVCKYSPRFSPDKSILGKVTRICNIAPKLREFRALNTLRNFTLAKRIITPMEDKTNSWQSWLKKNYTPTIGQNEMITQCKKLNMEQQAVVKRVSSLVSSDRPEIMLMHGPPGTGKTTTLVALVLQLLVAYQKKSPSVNHRILICTPSNAAIDEIMRRLSRAISNMPNTGKTISMVRVGEGYAPELKKYTIDSKVEDMEKEKSTLKNIQTELQAVDDEISDFRRQITELKQLPKSNPILLDSKLSKLKEKEDLRKTLKKDYETTMNKQGKFNKDELQVQRSLVLQKSQIVCCTLSTSSTTIMTAFSKKFPERPFLCCIVDEASQTTEPETLLPLVLKIDKLLLIGDPHQLGATVLSNTAESKKYGQSLFSRHFQFYCRNKSSSPVMTLTCQYRMHSQIVSWPNQYFYESQLTSKYTSPSTSFPLRPYFFFNLSAGREHSAKEGQIENADEVIMVKAVIDTIDDMLHSLKAKWTIGIITPYSAQRHSIRIALKNQTYRSFTNLEVDTVDGFQGQERDIIILSCVRTDATGFLKSPNRLNVALTRAKHSLYIIGDVQCLSKENMWRCLVQDAARHGNKFDVNSGFRNDLKVFKNQLNQLLSKNKTT